MAANETSPIFHIGVVVPDLEVAKQQLGSVLGVTWGELRRVRYGDWDLQAVTSIEGPPHLELQQGSPGSPWDAQGTARFDHIQCWSPDRRAEIRRLAAEGVAVDVDGESVGQPFAYLRTVDGLRIEILDEEMRPHFRSISRIDGADRAG
jgi:hypothetical protein